jgi:hypothetical protein
MQPRESGLLLAHQTTQFVIQHTLGGGIPGIHEVLLVLN